MLPYCTGGCNNLKIGMACGGSCEAGKMAGVRIDCFPKGIDYQIDQNVVGALKIEMKME